MGGFRRQVAPKPGGIAPRPARVKFQALPGARRRRNAEGPRHPPRPAGGAGGPRGCSRAAPRASAGLSKAANTRPQSSAQPRSRAVAAGAAAAEARATLQTSLPELDPAALPVRFPVRLPRQEVPGAASVAPQPSARRGRLSSRAQHPGFWCLAAVSGARPRARHPWGRTYPSSLPATRRWP